jgi:DNA-directed RNA polymerase specialized sigma24 family protein
MGRPSVSASADLTALMEAVVALLIAEREERLSSAGDKKSVKTEVLLSGAGLTAADIARLMGRNVGAVQKAIQRGHK